VERVFDALSLALLVAAIITYIAIIRDALPHLSVDERNALHFWESSISFHQWRMTDRAIGNAWKIHTSIYPESHKRLLFAALIITGALSLFGFPLWTALHTSP
jgi:hypothetical protein